MPQQTFIYHSIKQKSFFSFFSKEKKVVSYAALIVRTDNLPPEKKDDFLYALNQAHRASVNAKEINDSLYLYFPGHIDIDAANISAKLDNKNIEKTQIHIFAVDESHITMSENPKNFIGYVLTSQDFNHNLEIRQMARNLQKDKQISRLGALNSLINTLLVRHSEIKPSSILQRSSEQKAPSKLSSPRDMIILYQDFPHAYIIPERAGVEVSVEQERNNHNIPTLS